MNGIALKQVLGEIFVRGFKNQTVPSVVAQQLGSLDDGANLGQSTLLTRGRLMCRLQQVVLGKQGVQFWVDCRAQAEVLGR